MLKSFFYEPIHENLYLIHYMYSIFVVPTCTTWMIRDKTFQYNLIFKLIYGNYCMQK